MSRSLEAGGFFSDWKSLIRLEQASVKYEAAAFKALLLNAEGALFLAQTLGKIDKSLTTPLHAPLEERETVGFFGWLESQEQCHTFLDSATRKSTPFVSLH